MPYKKKQVNPIKPIPCFNLEAGKPTLEVAKTYLTSLIETKRRQRVRCVKIIHGYGSSGVGGRLRSGLRHYLDQLQGRQVIHGWVAGEDLASDSGSLKPYLEKFPHVKTDADFDRKNPGITIIFIH